MNKACKYFLFANQYKATLLKRLLFMKINEKVDMN